MMNKLIGFIIIFSLSLVSSCDKNEYSYNPSLSVKNGTIIGKVTDNLTNVQIPNAAITTQPITNSIYTDSSGIKFMMYHQGLTT